MDHEIGTKKDFYTLTAVSRGITTIVDSTTYFFGSKAGKDILITPAVQKIYLPLAGKITKVFVEWYATTAGSGENISMYLRLNDTTDYLIATLGNTNAFKLFSNTALNIPVVEGDFFEIKIVTPAWVTNPTPVSVGGQILVEA